MKKRDKIIYWAVTGLFTANMLLSAGMYFFKYDMVAEIISTLQYPIYIIYPLAIAKLLGLVAIWTNKSKILKEWAYAGFAFDFILAISAHVSINDGEFMPAAVALVLVLISYLYDRKIYGDRKTIIEHI